MPRRDRVRKCRFAFLDDRGTVAARFASFFAAEDRFAEAKGEDGLGGFIDATLRYVIPPTYRYTQAFKRDLAQVRKPSGGSLAIDRTGRVVIPPDRYKLFFLWDSTPLVSAFGAARPNCEIFVRPDGEELALPIGICGESANPLVPYGYALIHRDASRLLGTVDGEGRIGVPPTYLSLQPLNSRYLVFADAAYRGKNSGIVGVDGRVVLPLQPARIQSYGDGVYRQPGELRGLLIARTDAGAGLLNYDGVWRVSPNYYDVKVLSPDLLALETKDHRVEFADGTGKTLPLTSAYVSIPSKISGAFKISRCERVSGNLQCVYGLADRTGQAIVPPRFDEIEEKEGGLWHVRVQDGYRTLWGVYDSLGKELIAPIFTELDRRAGLQAIVASDRDYHAVLIDPRGRELARYRTLRNYRSSVRTRRQ